MGTNEVATTDTAPMLDVSERALAEIRRMADSSDKFLRL